MSFDVVINENRESSLRLEKCINCSKRIHKRTSQLNAIIEREMNTSMLSIDRNYNAEKAMIDRSINNQKETIVKLQTMLRVFREFKTTDLINKLKGANYQAALKKFINHEIDKELKQNDPSSISQQRFHKFAEAAHSKMNNSIERFKKFDARLTKTPISKMSHTESFSALRNKRDNSKKTSVSLPYLMMNPLFESNKIRKTREDIKYDEAVFEFERLYEMHNNRD